MEEELSNDITELEVRLNVLQEEFDRLDDVYLNGGFIKMYYDMYKPQLTIIVIEIYKQCKKAVLNDENYEGYMSKELFYAQNDLYNLLMLIVGTDTATLLLDKEMNCLRRKDYIFGTDTYFDGEDIKICEQATAEILNTIDKDIPDSQIMNRINDVINDTININLEYEPNMEIPFYNSEMYFNNKGFVKFNNEKSYEELDKENKELVRLTKKRLNINN